MCNVNKVHISLWIIFECMCFYGTFLTLQGVWERRNIVCFGADYDLWTARHLLYNSEGGWRPLDTGASAMKTDDWPISSYVKLDA